MLELNQSGALPEFHHQEMMNYILQTVATPALCCIGLFGNFLVIMILKTPRMRSTFHQSLLSLAVCDILFLALIIIDTFGDYLYPIYILMFPHVFNPMKNILLCWETFLIMSISTERYLAICRPLLYRSHKLRLSQRAHLFTFIFPPIFSAIFINIPKFFETKLVTENVCLANGSILEIYDYTLTDLRMNPDYIYYYTHLVKNLFTGIIPLFYLLFLNISILREIKKTSRSSRRLQETYNLRRISGNASMTSTEESSSTKRSQQYFLTLGIIVVLFLLCNTPRIILNFLDHYYEDFEDFAAMNIKPEHLEFFILISHFFLVINSASNFLIYFSVCNKFKNILMNKLESFRRSRSLQNEETDLER